MLSDYDLYPLGIGSNIVTDNQMSASTYDASFLPQQGRLNSATGSWRPAVDDELQWLQVDLGSVSYVIAMATQGGRDPSSGWVTTFLVSFSKSGAIFEELQQHGKRRVGSDLSKSK